MRTAEALFGGVFMAEKKGLVQKKKKSSRSVKNWGETCGEKWDIPTFQKCPAFL